MNNRSYSWLASTLAPLSTTKSGTWGAAWPAPTGRRANSTTSPPPSLFLGLWFPSPGGSEQLPNNPFLGGQTFWFCKCKHLRSKLNQCKGAQKCRAVQQMGIVSWTLFLHQASAYGKLKKLTVRSRISRLLHYANVTRQPFRWNFRKGIFT